MPPHGDVAQLARAPALQAGGRGFESHRLHHLLASNRWEYFLSPVIDERGIERGRALPSERSTSGVLGISIPKAVMFCRTLVAERALLSEAVAMINSL